jgi:uncharacterized protein
MHRLSCFCHEESFLFQTHSTRPTFPRDITPEEKALMDAHGVYCKQQFEDGKLLIYGPVLAREGAFGMAILEVADENEARQFGENDPSVQAGLNRFEFFPMHVSNARARA